MLAREAGICLEELLRTGVADWLDRPAPDFAEVSAYILEKNRELYCRLA